MGLARISGTRNSSRRKGVLPKRLDLKRSANGPRSQRVRAGKLGQNAVRWSAFVLLRPGTGRAPALGQHALTSAATIWTILQRAMAGSEQANSRVCFAVSFFRLDHSFRGGEFFKG